MPKKPHHTRIALHEPRNHGDYILFCRHVHDMMDGNAHFPNPNPALAVFAQHIDAFAAAATAAQAHTRGLADAALAPHQQLVNDVHMLAAYVQSVADANPDQAVAIIVSSGFGVTTHGAAMRAILRAVMGPGGLVLLYGHAAPGHAQASYEWQVSSDGGATWTALPSTPHAHTSVAGLTVGKTYFFRFRFNVPAHVGEWCSPVELLVH